MPVYRIKKHRSHVPAKEWARFQSHYQSSMDDKFRKLERRLKCQWRKSHKGEDNGISSG